MKTKRILNVISMSIALLFISCSSNISTMRDLPDPYVVVSISGWNSKTYCLYSLSTNVTYISIQNNVIIIDSIGKYSISDTVYVCLEKKHKASKKLK